MSRGARYALFVLPVAAVLGAFVACGGGDPAPADGAASTTPAGPEAPAEPETPVAAPAEPVPSLLMVQAQFATEGGRPVPKPAKLVILRKVDDTWFREEIEDPESNVFHKAMAYDGGILTIGAMGAKLKLWTRGEGGWTAETLWSKSWGGKFDRLRDLEIGDVDGDGTDDLVIATHDQGVVAVGRKGADGWAFVEMDQSPDTFVHEIEIGDVDGDGTDEFYATPSARNKASGVSQPGSVVRYDPKGEAFEASTVVDYEESHAKEILVTDVDADGTDELYVVREAHTVKEGGVKKRVDPVRIVRFVKDGGAWKDNVAATLDDDQCRFLLAGDVDGDGQTELIAAGYKSGLWLLEPKGDGTFETTLIDKDSSGFEHATHATDLDGDGKLEIYVAADDQKQIRVYTWNGSGFDRAVVGEIGPDSRSHITWNLQDGVF